MDSKPTCVKFVFCVFSVYFEFPVKVVNIIYSIFTAGVDVVYFTALYNDVRL